MALARRVVPLERAIVVVVEAVVLQSAAGTAAITAAATAEHCDKYNTLQTVYNRSPVVSIL
jgi:hypothetical protein